MSVDYRSAAQEVVVAFDTFIKQQQFSKEPRVNRVFGEKARALLDANTKREGEDAIDHFEAFIVENSCESRKQELFGELLENARQKAAEELDEDVVEVVESVEEAEEAEEDEEAVDMEDVNE